MAISTPGVGGGGVGGTPDFKLQGLSRDFSGGVEIFDLGIFGGQ